MSDKIKPSGQAKTSSLYRRLWRDWLKRQRGRVLLSFGLMLVVGAASAAYAKGIQIIIGAFQIEPQKVVIWGPVAILALSVVKAAALYWQALISHDTRMNMETALKKAMYGKLVRTDLAQLQTEAPAGLASRFTSDIGITGSAVNATSQAALSVITMLAAFGTMLSIDWPMTLAIGAIFLVAVWPINRIGTRLRQISRQTQAQVARMAASVTESLSGILMVRTYQLEDQMSSAADRIFEDLHKARQKARKWQARVLPLMEVLGGVSVALLLFLVAWRLSRGSTTIADFLGLLTAVGVATGPARGLGQNFASIQQGAGAMERIFGLFDSENTIRDGSEARAVDRARGAISFENVGFAYPGGKTALEDVSFQISAGERVAFVGRSGAGKSTIFKLLPRLFDVTSGVIRLDGEDLRNLKIASLRRQIAVVGQDSVLLSGTVADNIGFGRVGATRNDIVAAAKAAAADGFISALPQGYDTELGDTGVKLSGGERQRLSIARAILRDAPVLLLDEPTSALDAESEAAIRTALKKLEKGRTTLIIAHRLATILDADKIIVIDEGRVAERGAHSELLARNGLYAELYRLQFAAQE